MKNIQESAFKWQSPWAILLFYDTATWNSGCLHEQAALPTVQQSGALLPF